ncbi:hypothetical protein QBC38DRAFT_158456 [Podospora fimiseda]|uniref:Uncharacterized protein n=1 Tax=Podospora fimiseda TaxID=252190 RepID=A0AAN7BRQ8_9PEZI|nr:hypothetical protein QBC38DRAFT_158456 [Podospora fimiseda]
MDFQELCAVTTRCQGSNIFLFRFLELRNRKVVWCHIGVSGSEWHPQKHPSRRRPRFHNSADPAIQIFTNILDLPKCQETCTVANVRFTRTSVGGHPMSVLIPHVLVPHDQLAQLSPIDDPLPRPPAARSKDRRSMHDDCSSDCSKQRQINHIITNKTIRREEKKIWPRESVPVQLDPAPDYDSFFSLPSELVLLYPSFFSIWQSLARTQRRNGKRRKQSTAYISVPAYTQASGMMMPAAEEALQIPRSANCSD